MVIKANTQPTPSKPENFAKKNSWAQFFGCITTTKIIQPSETKQIELRKKYNLG